MACQITPLRRFNVKVRYKLFHNSRGTPFVSGEVKCANNRVVSAWFKPCEEGSTIGDQEYLTLLAGLVPQNVRVAIESFMADPQFCYIWSEDSCLEVFVQETTI